MKTTRERAQEAREAKLAQIREQVDNGSLVIRKMTAQERERWGKATSRVATRPNGIQRHTAPAKA